MTSKKTRSDSSSFSARVRDEVTASIPKKSKDRLAILAGSFVAEGDGRAIFASEYFDRLAERDEEVPDIDPGDSRDRRNFLKGVFIAAGYCSDPSKSYRIELHVPDLGAVNIVTGLLEAERLAPSCAQRDGMYAVYLKNGDDVADFLGMIGASNMWLEFENVRAEHEVLGNINRAMNCDLGNTKRQAEAGAVRNEAIRRLMNSDKAKDLSDDLRMAAEVNLANPGASLKELGELMDPPISKSGMNHRIKKLLELAENTV